MTSPQWGSMLTDSYSHFFTLSSLRFFQLLNCSGSRSIRRLRFRSSPLLLGFEWLALDGCSQFFVGRKAQSHDEHVLGLRGLLNAGKFHP